MPIALGPGVPALASCARMYCISRVLTASQCRFNSSATSLMVLIRQRRPDEPSEALGVERIVGKEIELLAHHLGAAVTANPTHLELQVDPRVAAGQIARTSRRAVVPAHMRSTTFLADGFFERRTSVMTRANGSPNTPPICSKGRNPGNRYASRRRLRLRG